MDVAIEGGSRKRAAACSRAGASQGQASEAVGVFRVRQREVAVVTNEADHELVVVRVWVGRRAVITCRKQAPEEVVGAPGEPHAASCFRKERRAHCA